MKLSYNMKSKIVCSSLQSLFTSLKSVQLYETEALNKIYNSFEHGWYFEHLPHGSYNILEIN